MVDSIIWMMFSLRRTSDWTGKLLHVTIPAVEQLVTSMNGRLSDPSPPGFVPEASLGRGDVLAGSLPSLLGLEPRSGYCHQLFLNS